jgi:hypothetical protein
MRIPRKSTIGSLSAALLITTAVACSAMLAGAGAASAQSGPKPTPLADSNGLLPLNYKGPVFKLSHDYPGGKEASAEEAPWRKATGGGGINVENAGRIAEILKDYVSRDMRLMLTDSPRWNPAELHWYNEPWTGYLREATHGVYVGSSPMAADLFKESGLTKPFSTYVLTFYDKRAGYMLGNVWGKSATSPNIVTEAGQFMENSIVVKAAFSTANEDVWPVMAGALPWTVYITVNATKQPNPLPAPELTRVSLFQFDIVVKSTELAPDTGWVFMTLVYDKDAPGDFWDKMVPLGVMWGNDPDVDSAAHPDQPLKQNWINPRAPAYSKATLGWGGRLSGPNDGARNDAVVDGAIPSVAPNLPSSSCLSCHSVSEWPMKSFLLPTATDPQVFPPIGLVNSDYLVMWPPGSTTGGPDKVPAWTHWFQSRSGSQPADEGTQAFDYDMVTTFKSLSAWASVQPTEEATRLTAARRTLLMSVEGKSLPPLGGYNGRPFGAD